MESVEVGTAWSEAGSRSHAISHQYQSSAGRASLQEMVAMKLSTKKEVMYPAHAFGRGGVGNFLATGCSRAGLIMLPHGSKATSGIITARALSAGSASNTTSRPWTTAGSSTTILPGGLNSTSMPTSSTAGRSWGSARSSRMTASSSLTSKAWEQAVAHPHDFLSAARSSRIHDVPAANRWAAMSFYENDPSEIKRHIDITSQLDQLHEDGKRQQQADDTSRRMAWAAQQRSTFRRQRQEVALRYQTLGLALRPTHQHLLDTQMSDMTVHAAGVDQNTADAPQQPAAASVPLPKPTYVKIYDRMGAELRDSLRLKEEQWRQGRQSARQNREKAEVSADVASLEHFEEQLQTLLRQRARSQYAEPE